jgi:uncharacterized membrane protein (Fun14 family)
MSDSIEKNTNPPVDENPETSTAPVESSVWRSPSVLIAAVVMLAGLGIWIFSTIRSDQETGHAPRGAGTSALTDSRAYGDEEVEPEEDILEPISPVAFRLGAGYLGGFFLGWAFRKFIKLTVLIAGGLVAMLAVFQGLGWFEVNWPAVENHLQMSLAWVHGQAGSFKTFVTGYLPSAGAATAGMVVGFRR